MYHVVGLDSTGPINSDTNEPDKPVIDSEKTAILNEALAQLPLQQREVIILYLQGDMKFKQIAEVQGVSINTVQSRYHYGLEKLQSLLDSEAI